MVILGVLARAGFCFTDDKEIYELLLSLRSHGWAKQNSPEEQKRLVEKYKIDNFHTPFTFYYPGFNVRPLDIQSFFGIQQMKKIDGFFKQRHKNHIRYAGNLRGTVSFQDYAQNNSLVASISFGALAKDNQERRNIVKALVENGIETRIYSAGSLDQHPAWYERYPKINDPLSLKIHQTGFFCPNRKSFILRKYRFYKRSSY